LFKTGPLIPKMILNGKFYKTKPVGKPRIRWEDVVRRDTSQILGIRRWRRRPEDGEEWREAFSEGGQRHRWNGISHTFARLPSVFTVYASIARGT